MSNGTKRIILGMAIFLLLLFEIVVVLFTIDHISLNVKFIILDFIAILDVLIMIGLDNYLGLD
ncbi:hypothetical protein KCK34_002825 [Clostridium perfringens]|nr:hypothetical protein [Clostridium perfringens]EHK2336340.1 hypothetical protein [Clostridium perfringens]ELC8426415.1 hypothetical protein [Clostridium perfringens]ELU5587551.1 hypothetical protein [Clostridium perfringens]MDM0461704.1 hypothetical protein [Clostridium perfringens]